MYCLKPVTLLLHAGTEVEDELAPGDYAPAAASAPDALPLQGPGAEVFGAAGVQFKEVPWVRCPVQRNASFLPFRML